MEKIKEYCTRVCALLERITATQLSQIERAAVEIVRRIKEDRLIYVIGTGAHSMMMAMEMFKRAGGLSRISPLFPPGLGDFEGHPKTERLPGYAALVLDYYRVGEGDLLIIANVNGINALTIETALECRKRGITSVAVTSVAFSRAVEHDIPARHPGNQDLCDLADIVIDAGVPAGDALLRFEEMPDVPVGPGSTYPMAFIVNAIVVRVAELLLREGLDPEVRKSGNLRGGLERSRELFDHKYYQRIKHY
jgi:uncharacterized phosphosugar-binding protein